MIQRIQTVYLLLSGISSIIALILGFTASPDSLVVSAFKGTDILRYAYLGLIIVGLAIAIWSIFMFNNRKRQMRFTDISSVALILSCVVIAAAYFMNNCEASWANVPVCLTIVSVILNILAKSRIKYDERLVNDSDRLWK